MLRRRDLLRTAAVLAGASLVVAGCAPAAPTASSSGAAASGPAGSGSGSGGAADTLTIATTSDVVNFNPLVGNSRTDYWITNLMYPHLLSIDASGNKTPRWR